MCCFNLPERSKTGVSQIVNPICELITIEKVSLRKDEKIGAEINGLMSGYVEKTPNFIFQEGTDTAWLPTKELTLIQSGM